MIIKPWQIIAGAAVILGGLAFMANRQPRGIRNNNPLNIELGDPWQGLAATQTDGRFAQFTDARYGYRAAARIIASYRRRGVQTLAQIISTWAPSVENDTGAYIDSVARRAGLEPDEVVTDEQLPRLFEAMTWHENGQQPYTMSVIETGVSWA